MVRDRRLLLDSRSWDGLLLWERVLDGVYPCEDLSQLCLRDRGDDRQVEVGL